MIHFSITGTAKAVAETNTSIAINTHSEVVWHLDLIQDRGRLDFGSALRFLTNRESMRQL